ncbi:MAG: AI-2E family transporter [Chloroflexota bacterium]|nr:AI-2E family transporter [Chloroflexota bacterium]
MTARDRDSPASALTRGNRSSKRHRASRQPIRLEFALQSVLTVLLALVLTVILLWVARQLWQILILIVFSVMLAVALTPLVHWLMRHHLTRGKAVAVTSILLLAGIALLLAIVVPALIDQGQTVRDRFPEVREDVAEMLRDRDRPQLADQVARFEITDVVQPGQLASGVPRGFGVLAALLTMLILTIYILSDAERIVRFMYFLIPEKHHIHVDNLLPALSMTVGGYLRGQLITSASITLVTFVILLVVGAPNALGLALLAGIADAVPIVGAFVAVIAATLAALSVSSVAALIVLILLIAYQQIEDRLLVPRVYGKTLRLPPIAVFLAVIIGARLLGIVGALLALPAASAMRTVLQYVSSVRHGRIEPVNTEHDLLAAAENGDVATLVPRD